MPNFHWGPADTEFYTHEPQDMSSQTRTDRNASCIRQIKRENCVRAGV